jgi:beta-1,4-N-acetylglucosaminyltransferase
MIFFTVGTIVEPFDRLITVAGELIAESNERLVVQHGTASWPHVGIDAFDFLPASVIDGFIREARVVASHGGIGTIAACLRHQTPVVVLSRRVSLREQVDDHQEQFARRVASLGYVQLTANSMELKNALCDPNPVTARQVVLSGRLGEAIGRAVAPQELREI